MSKVFMDYEINPATCILLPAKEIDYDTIVIEQEKKLFVRKTPMQLIEAACIRNGASYKGITESVLYNTGYKRKAPIPICKCRGIYAFPTHAVTSYECAWVFPNHIQFYQPLPPMERGTRKESLIVFQNNEEVSLEISQYGLKTQIEKTNYCKYIYSVV